MKTKLISCCAKKHLNVFLHGSGFIKNYIKADSYQVYVHSEIFEYLKKISEWSVIDEKNINNSYISNYKGGWIRQQLLKILGIYEAAKEGYEQLIIWDGDSIPLKPIRFFENNKVNYIKASEYHGPYFNTIQKLLEIEREVNFSFISQCFPLKSKWIIDFIKFVEEKHNKNWWEAIIDCTINGRFSEYETLGTFINKNYKEEVNYIKVKWSRKNNMDRKDVLSNNFSEKLILFSNINPDLVYTTFE